MSSDLEKLREKLRASKVLSSSACTTAVTSDKQSDKIGKQLSCLGLTISLSGREILKQVSVTFKPGEITAILGPSGSGKSTLLKSLISLYTPDAGSVLYAKADMKTCLDEFRANMGYVPQDDIIHRSLTVVKALYYSSKLRLESSVSDDEIGTRIDTVLNKLLLSERKNLKINKLSGGQRKRVNIAVELLADPETLILDEPASGLDPGTESDLFRSVAETCSRGSNYCYDHSLYGVFE